MLNKEKIRWMSRASIYEKHEGQTDLRRNKYFFGDYVRINLLKNLISFTIAYLLIVGIYVVHHFEEVFMMLANMQAMVLLKEVLLIYVLLVIIYTIAGLAFYIWQYQSSSKRVKKYYRILRHIEKFDEKEEKAQEEKR